MSTHGGFLSRAAFLEAQRQEALELAERAEHMHGEGHPATVSLYRYARRLLEEIQEEERVRS